MGDLVLIGSCNGIVHGVEKATGKPRWTYDARADGGQPEFHGSPFITEELMILGSDARSPEGVGHLYAFERSGGRLRWKRRVGHGAMTDVIGLGDSVYAVTLEDEIVCLEASTGHLNWSVPSGAANVKLVNVVATPAAAGERVFFGGRNGLVHAVNARSGGIIWKKDVGSAVETGLALRNGRLLLGTEDGRIMGLAVEDGAVLAALSVGGRPLGALVTAGASLLVLVADARHELVLKAVDASLKSILWSQGTPGGWSSARPYLWRGAVLAGSERGALRAFALADGAPLWSDQLEGVIRGIGTDDDGVLYVGTLKGSVYAFTPAPVADERR